MAIRRTLRQKQQTQEKRQLVTYELPPQAQDKASTQTLATPPKVSASTTIKTSLFGYPLSLIYGDIAKTLVASLIIFGALAFLKIYHVV